MCSPSSPKPNQTTNQLVNHRIWSCDGFISGKSGSHDEKKRVDMIQVMRFRGSDLLHLGLTSKVPVFESGQCSCRTGLEIPRHVPKRTPQAPTGSCLMRYITQTYERDLCKITAVAELLARAAQKWYGPHFRTNHRPKTPKINLSPD
jgi:hypothetical protein